jgi:hypothetical protein
VQLTGEYRADRHQQQRQQDLALITTIGSVAVVSAIAAASITARTVAITMAGLRTAGAVRMPSSPTAAMRPDHCGPVQVGLGEPRHGANGKHGERNGQGAGESGRGERGQPASGHPLETSAIPSQSRSRPSSRSKPSLHRS